MESISAPLDLKRARQQKPARSIDRLPPHDLQMEMGVLGCQLLDPNKCVGELVIKLGSEIEAHYDLRHQTIQKSLFELYERRAVIDLISVQLHLKDKKMLEQIGGIPYLSQLQDVVPSAANFSYYVEKLIEKHTLRRMIQVCSGTVGKIYDYEGDIDLLLDEVEKEILSVRRARVANEPTTGETVSEAIQMIEDVFNGDGSITGLPTGLKDLDKATDGLHKGETICIAAYPGCGKSSLALNIAVFLALLGYKVNFYSYEMKAVRLMIRAICAESRVNFFDVRDKKISDEEIVKMGQAAKKIAASNIRVKNAAGMTIAQIQADARRDKQKSGLDLAVIDHLQLVPNPLKDSKEQEVSSASGGAKALAMELDIPVIILSQLNDDGKLNWSRAIGQDAGDVWKIELDGEKKSFAQPVNLIIDKGRDSVAGTSIPLMFLKTITRFECRARSSETERAESN